MHSTAEFEHLLDTENVVAVYWDDDSETVRVIVTEKVPEDELPEDAIISNVAPDVTTDVLDGGLERDADGFTPEELKPGDDPDVPAPQAGEAVTPKQRTRPVLAGVSEIHEQSTAATAGHYPAVVLPRDSPDGRWADTVAPGDLVRISNNHVYARRNQAEFGDRIRQPSPYDGGQPRDTSGELVGYVPLRDGGGVDVAARSVDPHEDAVGGFNLPVEWPTGVIRENYPALEGETVRKSGRTTGLTSGSVLSTDAAVRVTFGGGLGVLTLRGQIIASDMSRGGDSGSPIYTEAGELVGHLFAGSDRFTIINRADDIERHFGIRLLTEAPPSAPADGRAWGHDSFRDRVWAFLGSVAGDRLRRNVYLEELGRWADLVVDAGGGPWVGEVATSTRMLLEKVGPVLAFASQYDEARPLIIVPEALEIPSGEREALEAHVTIMTDVDVLARFA